MALADPPNRVISSGDLTNPAKMSFPSSLSTGHQQFGIGAIAFGQSMLIEKQRRDAPHDCNRDDTKNLQPLSSLQPVNQAPE
ncbi:MAG: hypothetical protein EOO82_01090 [Oxalobacteraceae bacterium]|nr:MAG: hypothetical protein EOO82_01090 [Oxalobacteraceae bacterium]